MSNNIIKENYKNSNQDDTDSTDGLTDAISKLPSSSSSSSDASLQLRLDNLKNSSSVVDDDDSLCDYGDNDDVEMVDAPAAKIAAAKIAAADLYTATIDTSTPASLRVDLQQVKVLGLAAAYNKVEKMRSAAPSADHYKINLINNRRVGRRRCGNGVVDCENDIADMKERLQIAIDMKPADEIAHDIDQKIQQEQQRIEAERSAVVEAPEPQQGRRVGKRKYDELEIDWSVVIAAQRGKSYHLDSLFAAMVKLEKTTGVSMSKDAREQRTCDLDLGLPIARAQQNLPDRRAKLLNLNSTRELDKDHTRMCRALNNALRAGSRGDLGDITDDQVRKLLDGYIAKSKKKKEEVEIEDEE